MTNKATGEGVVVDAPFLSSIDVVQLAKRYREFCPVPETRTCPGSPNDYYLKGRECNGWIDCPDARDEVKGIKILDKSNFILSIFVVTLIKILSSVGTEDVA